MKNTANGNTRPDINSPKTGVEDETGGNQADTVSTGKEQRIEPWQFKPGQSGNPAGRPRGSRNKLAEQFIADVHADWQEHGFEALEAARKTRPADYLKMVASIIPKDIKVSLETMTDGELATKIDQLAKSLGLELVPRSASHMLPNSDVEDEDSSETEH